jgi:membrane-associated phospholipid phosphatase
MGGSEVPAAEAWAMIARLGEAQIVLPAMALVLASHLWSARRRAAPLDLAVAWLGSLAIAASVTLASKLAFIGWCWGWAWADFTGVSGHTLVATAALPPLAGLLSTRWTEPARRALIGLACMLAVAVGASRVLLGFHSLSEVCAGWALGTLVAATALSRLTALTHRAAGWPALLVLVWGLQSVSQAPPSRSHDMVTALALQLSGHDTPFERADLHRAPSPR